MHFFSLLIPIHHVHIANRDFIRVTSGYTEECTIEFTTMPVVQKATDSIAFLAASWTNDYPVSYFIFSEVDRIAHAISFDFTNFIGDSPIHPAFANGVDPNKNMLRSLMLVRESSRDHENLVGWKARKITLSGAWIRGLCVCKEGCNSQLRFLAE